MIEIQLSAADAVFPRALRLSPSDHSNELSMCTKQIPLRCRCCLSASEFLRACRVCARAVPIRRLPSAAFQLATVPAAADPHGPPDPPSTSDRPHTARPVRGRKTRRKETEAANRPVVRTDTAHRAQRGHAGSGSEQRRLEFEGRRGKCSAAPTLRPLDRTELRCAQIKIRDRYRVGKPGSISMGRDEIKTTQGARAYAPSPLTL